MSLAEAQVHGARSLSVQGFLSYSHVSDYVEQCPASKAV